MDPLIARQRLLAARDLLRFNIEVAKLCHSFGGFFVWEHPQSACSWNEPEVVQYLQGDLVSEVVFDQCRVGLLSKVGLLPMRKATRLAGTAIHVLDLFFGACAASAQCPIRSSLALRAGARGRSGPSTTRL